MSESASAAAIYSKPPNISSFKSFEIPSRVSKVSAKSSSAVNKVPTSNVSSTIGNRIPRLTTNSEKNKRLKLFNKANESSTKLELKKQTDFGQHKSLTNTPKSSISKQSTVPNVVPSSSSLTTGCLGKGRLGKSQAKAQLKPSCTVSKQPNVGLPTKQFGSKPVSHTVAFSSSKLVQGIHCSRAKESKTESMEVDDIIDEVNLNIYIIYL